MTKFIHKFILLLMVLGFTVSALAASEAEYKKLSKSWTLNPDGSQEFHYNMELTIYTHTAMRSAYGETFVVYNPDYQTLKINTSYTKQKDGTIIKTPDNAFVEVLPRAAVNAPAYNNLKEMVIVHTGLELGATIYLDYTLTSKAGYLPAIDIFEPIQTSSPIKELNLSVSVPESSNLSYSLVNPEVKAKTSVNNEMRTVTWTLKNVKAASRAPMKHFYDRDIQYLTVSSFASKAAALKYLYTQFETCESMPLLSLAETVAEGKNTDTEKLQAILKFVNNDFEHSVLSLVQTGYRIRSVEDVINSAYGTHAELTDLLQGLLNALHIPAEVCAYFPTTDTAENSLGLSNIALFIKAEADGKTYLLNPESDRMDNVGWLADRCHIVSLKNGNAIALPQASSKRSYDVIMTIEADKVSSIVKSQFAREFDTYLNPADRESTASASLQKQNGFVIVPLESPTLATYQRYAAMNSTRDCNLSLLYAPEETYTYTIQMPEGWTLSTPTGEKNISNAAGTLTMSVQKTGNKVEIKRCLKVNSSLITPDTYPAFHALMAAWVNPNNTQLLFQGK